MKIVLIKDNPPEPWRIVDEMVITKDTDICTAFIPHEDKTKRKQIVILRNPNKDMMKFEMTYEN